MKEIFQLYLSVVDTAILKLTLGSYAELPNKYTQCWMLATLRTSTAICVDRSSRWIDRSPSSPRRGPKKVLLPFFCLFNCTIVRFDDLRGTDIQFFARSELRLKSLTCKWTSNTNCSKFARRQCQCPIFNFIQSLGNKLIRPSFALAPFVLARIQFYGSDQWDNLLLDRTWNQLENAEWSLPVC